MGNSISDFKKQFYGNLVDAEYQFFKDAAAAGITARSLLTGIGGAAPLATDIVSYSKVTGDTQNRWQRDAAGKHSWGSGALAVDTNLYRSTANILKTDSNFYSISEIRASEGTSARTRIGNVGPSNESGILFGSAGDTNLYRSAADTLRTPDTFSINGNTQITPGGVVDLLRADGGSYIQGLEQSADPAAPAANGWRLFGKDNGSGKTLLCVRFASGAVQTIATEP